MKLIAPLFFLGTCTFLLGLLYMSWFGFIEVEAEIYNAGVVYCSLGILAILLGFFFEQLVQRAKVWSAVALVLATLIAVLHFPPLLLWLSNAPATDNPTLFPNAQTALYPVLHFFSLLCFVWLLRSSKPRQILQEQNVPLILIALVPVSILMTWFLALELQTNQPVVYSLPDGNSAVISDEVIGQPVGIPSNGNEPFQSEPELTQPPVPAYEKWYHPILRGTHIYSQTGDAGRTYYFSQDYNTSTQPTAEIFTKHYPESENLPYTIIWEPNTPAAIIQFLDESVTGYSVYLVQASGAYGSTHLPIEISVEQLKLPSALNTMYTPVSWVYPDTILLRKTAPANDPKDSSLDTDTYWTYSLTEKRLLKQVEL